jgi:NAD(P)-dependent dehydrogenase (short-subunit alcohol dehydrogenase family)
MHPQVSGGHMIRRLEGKVALITGGSRGIGAAAVRRFVVEGARVVVADLLDEEGRAFVHELRARDGHVGFMKMDVTSPLQWAEAIEGVEKTFGALHILVNNAGIARLEDVETEELEQWNKILAVDETGVWLGMKAAIPAMKRAGGGSIINVSSIYGAVGGNGTSIAYHAAKGAVRSMTKSAAIRYAREGIRVNSVHPGFVDTSMIEPFFAGHDDNARAFRNFVVERTPMGRVGQPEEIAGAIAFLASNDATYVTGSEIYVDGGWTAA